MPLDEVAVTVASPAATALTIPFVDTVTTDSSLDVQVIVLSVVFSGKISADNLMVLFL